MRNKKATLWESIGGLKNDGYDYLYNTPSFLSDGSFAGSNWILDFDLLRSQYEESVQFFSSLNNEKLDGSLMLGNDASLNHEIISGEEETDLTSLDNLKQSDHELSPLPQNQITNNYGNAEEDKNENIRSEEEPSNNLVNPEVLSEDLIKKINDPLFAEYVKHLNQTYKYPN